MYSLCNSLLYDIYFSYCSTKTINIHTWHIIYQVDLPILSLYFLNNCNRHDPCKNSYKLLYIYLCMTLSLDLYTLYDLYKTNSQNVLNSYSITQLTTISKKQQPGSPGNFFSPTVFLFFHHLFSFFLCCVPIVWIQFCKSLFVILPCQATTLYTPIVFLLTQ